MYGIDCQNPRDAGLSSHEGRIADYLLDNVEGVRSLSSKSLAELAGLNLFCVADEWRYFGAKSRRESADPGCGAGLAPTGAFQASSPASIATA